MTDHHEKLRRKYIEFMAKLRNKRTFDEGLYDSIFDDLSLQASEFREGGSVPIRIFEVCIDLMYGLARNDKLSENVRERLDEARDEVYGLLMNFD